jgi:hypothetical protein
MKDPAAVVSFHAPAHLTSGGLELARGEGAECVIDRTSCDVFNAARGPFDIVFDAAASYRWLNWRRHLRPRDLRLQRVADGLAAPQHGRVLGRVVVDVLGRFET